MGQLIGAGIQLGIGKLVAFADQSNVFRRELSLLFEQLMQAIWNRIGSFVAIPLMEQLLAFSGVEQRQIGKTLCRVAQQLTQNGFQVSEHALDGPGFEQIAIVFGNKHQLLAQFFAGDGEIELGGAGADAPGFQL